MSTNKIIRQLFENDLHSQVATRLLTQGNYTVCLLQMDGREAIGIAKRNPDDDPYLPLRGIDIASMRAAKNFVKLYPFSPSLYGLLDHKTLYRLGVE